MVRRLLPVMITLAAVLSVWELAPGDSHQARAAQRHRTSPDLFYNYYVPPVGYGGVGAELYLSPRPTPPLVGHTYVTYQPLMPHEMLYPHHRTYYRYNGGSGWTKTCVSWNRSWLDFSWLHGPPKPINAPRWCNKFSH